MDNLGKITLLRAPSQELESERPPGPHERPSAVGPAAESSLGPAVYSKPHANRGIPREGCVCRACRQARRRFDLPLAPLDDVDTTPPWVLALVWVTAAAVGLAWLWALGKALLWVLGA